MPPPRRIHADRDQGCHPRPWDDLVDQTVVDNPPDEWELFEDGAQLSLVGRILSPQPLAICHSILFCAD